MSKIVLLFVISCLCLVNAQNDRAICDRLSRTCQANQQRIGTQDDITRFLNAGCVQTNPGWRPITRCEMERVACEFAILRCSSMSCENIAQALGR